MALARYSTLLEDRPASEIRPSYIENKHREYIENKHPIWSHHSMHSMHIIADSRTTPWSCTRGVCSSCAPPVARQSRRSEVQRGTDLSGALHDNGLVLCSSQRLCDRIPLQRRCG